MEEEIHVQMEDNSPSIEHSLRLISYTSWLLGVGIARPRKCPKAITITLRIVHLAVCSVIVAYGAIDFFTFGSVFKSDIFKIMYYMNKVMCYVSAYYYVYHGIRQYDKWPELMDRIKEIDQKIRKEIPMNDRPIKNVETLAILMIFACGPLSLIVHALYYYFTRPENIFASDLLLYYTIAQSLINSFVFDVVVYVLYRRFQTINELIDQLDQLFGAPWIALKIRRIRELYTGICDLVIMVNDIHGFHLLLCSANCFTMVVATLFRIYMGVVEKNYAFIVINNILWILYAMQFGLMCWICTLACKESDKIGISIYAIVLNCKPTNLDKLNGARNQSNLEVPPPLEGPDGEQNSNRSSNYNLNYVVMENILRKNLDRDCVRNEVNDFSIQLQQHRIAFTACDFFEMNNALLNNFVGVITTYLIILVQFYRPENPDAQFNRKR
ncbi:PREDICTED: uncharacterized protein LOC105149154 [Acromyrmex echinatior]|uniref:Gustatory receptor n=1 Tax=Acromyrmex echinatior TaxID=103372 RepID=F4WTV6_ACREC|nr:PREDICTED: uncharacterized protein LOC105149154 [Acromyrmex echinatior]EGI62313.1 hypothetical protein G5I_09308 [Acromyrmex echinatior]